MDQVRVKAKMEEDIPWSQKTLGRARTSRRPWFNHSLPTLSRAMWPLKDNPSLGVESGGQDVSAVCPRIPSPW